MEEMATLNVLSYPISSVTPQNIFLPLAVFKNYQKYKFALVSVTNEYKVLVKLRLIDKILLKKCCYYDQSVVVPTRTWREYNSCDRLVSKPEINLCDIRFLGNYQWCHQLDVSVVTNSLSALLKFKETNCNALLKEVLKLFVVAPGCIVFLDRLPVPARLECFCIIIKNNDENPNIVYRINDRTIVNIVDVLSYQMYIQTLNLQQHRLYDSLFLQYNTTLRMTTLERLTEKVKSVCELSKMASNIPLAVRPDKNILLSGASGSGKSSIVNAVARALSTIVLSVSCSDLPASQQCIVKFKEIFASARLHAQQGEPAIILLKDVDLLTVKRNDEVTPSSQVAVIALSQCLDEVRSVNGVSVIATTTEPENVDVDLRRAGRFSNEVEIPMLNEYDRSEVIKTVCKLFSLPCAEEVSVEVGRWTPGYLLSDFMGAVREVFNSYRQNKDDSIEGQLQYIRNAVILTPPSALKGTRGLISNSSIGEITFNDIGGLEEVKKILVQSVIWQIQYPERFTRLGIPPTKGILLHGPPGCAKTTLVKALAAESRATFLAVSAADLYSPYVGESEKRLSKLFTQARIATPAIIFLDEIDSIVGHKGSEREHGVQERVLATLLIEMDGIGVRVHTTDSSKKVAAGETADYSSSTSTRAVSNVGVIVVGAGNRPDLLDDALKRPGRFDKLIYIPPPNEVERLAILKTITRKMSLSCDVDLVSIAQRTTNYSGADLRNLCNESGMVSFTERGMDASVITAEDFETVLKKYVPSLKK